MSVGCLPWTGHRTLLTVFVDAVTASVLIALASSLPSCPGRTLLPLNFQSSLNIFLLLPIGRAGLTNNELIANAHEHNALRLIRPVPRLIGWFAGSLFRRGRSPWR